MPLPEPGIRGYPDEVKFFFKKFLLVSLLSVLGEPAFGLMELECYRQPGCRSRSFSSNPSTGGQVRINPSAVPTEKGLGVEGIFFKDEVDVALVRGLGRVGAAISPSNSEETFFGPPGYEVPEDFLRRKTDQTKYPGQKITLATAFDVAKRNGSGMNSYSLKLGLMGRYNRLTKNASPGGGLSGILGPFSFGGSIYNDESQFDYRSYNSTLQPVATYQVQTYNVGLFLSSLILDYSHLQVKAPDPATVQLYTATLTVKKVLLTASKRLEISSRPSYDYTEKKLEVLKNKEEYFGGIQVNVSRHLMLGVLYNYYLLREFSGTATVFF